MHPQAVQEGEGMIEPFLCGMLGAIITMFITDWQEKRK